MKRIFLSSLVAVSCILTSCKKDKEVEPTPVIVSPTPVTGIDLNLSYKIDGNSFMLNTGMYTNDAGNPYNITKLVYYISQITLIKADSSGVLVKDYQYVDATIPSTNKLTIGNIPAGNYIGISFNIGLDSVHNISNSLATTPENLNMAWPAMMGGGYHFMMLEGHYDSAGTSYGYAMHIGTNPYLVPHNKLYSNISVSANTTTPINLTMNINEWYRNPSTFNFNVDGSHIMGKVAMRKIADNGIDVFSF